MIFPHFSKVSSAFLLTKVLGLDLVKSHFVPRLKLLNMPWCLKTVNSKGLKSMISVSNCHASTRNRFFSCRKFKQTS